MTFAWRTAEFAVEGPVAYELVDHAHPYAVWGMVKRTRYGDWDVVTPSSMDGMVFEDLESAMAAVERARGFAPSEVVRP